MTNTRIILIFTSFLLFLNGCSKRASLIQCACKDSTTQAGQAYKESLWRSYSAKAIELYKHGEIDEAIKAGKQALNYAKKEFGGNDLRYATSLNNIAEFYRLKGKYGDAESNYNKSLSIREKVLGKEHPEVALLLNNLATSYFLQKRYEKAESLYLRAQSIIEKSVGKNHSSLETLYTNIGEFYKVQGKYNMAEPYLKGLVVIQEKKGKEDPLYAKALNDLAALYFLESKYDDAKPLFENSLSILEKKLGKNSQEVAVVLENMAEVYKKLGDENKAKELSQRVNEIRTPNQQHG